MPSLPVNTSVSVSLPAGSSINITGNGAWAFIATVSGREIASGSYVGPDVIGPFARAAVVGLTATVSDGLQYTVQDFAEGNSAAAALTTEQVTALQSVVSGDGNLTTTPPADVVRLTGQTAVKCGAGRLVSVRCEAGTSVAVTVYDRPEVGATGRVVYSGTLSAGEVAYPVGAWAVNGMNAAFASGTFEFELSEA